MASTNKTENLGLNKWEGSDYVLREDFNADNDILDTAVSAAFSRGSSALRNVRDVKYDLYNLALQSYYDGKETGLKKAYFFDGFADMWNVESISDFGLDLQEHFLHTGAVSQSNINEGKTTQTGLLAVTAMTKDEDDDTVRRMSREIHINAPCILNTLKLFVATVDNGTVELEVKLNSVGAYGAEEDTPTLELSQTVTATKGSDDYTPVHQTVTFSDFGNPELKPGRYIMHVVAKVSTTNNRDFYLVKTKKPVNGDTEADSYDFYTVFTFDSTRTYSSTGIFTSEGIDMRCDFEELTVYVRSVDAVLGAELSLDNGASWSALESGGWENVSLDGETVREDVFSAKLLTVSAGEMVKLRFTASPAEGCDTCRIHDYGVVVI